MHNINNAAGYQRKENKTISGEVNIVYAAIKLEVRLISEMHSSLLAV